MEIPFNDVRRQYTRFAGALEHSVLETLRSGWWLNGSRVRDFARQFAQYVNAAHCIPVANGTDALELALRAVSSTAPDRTEVITVANAGGYSSIAARSAGLVPVYADVMSSSQLLSIASAIACLSEDTLAVIATHLYGGVVDVWALREALNRAGRSDVKIVEDCAQSHGARLGAQSTGSLGDISAFSFYPTKNLPAVGDAGAVVTSSPELAAVVQSLQQYGWSAKYHVEREGGRNSRMDEIQAAALLAVLPHLDELNEERAEILRRYQEVADPSIQFIERAPGAVIHLAVVATEKRDELRGFLKACGIATDVHYPLLDCVQKGWKGNGSRVGPEGVKVSLSGAERVLSLPCFVGMTGAEIDHVSDALSRFSDQ